MTTLTFQSLGPGPIYTDKDVWLPLLLHEVIQAGGGSVIEGKTFVNCRLHGPAVIVPISGCQFEGCSLGQADGDMGNLMMQPLGRSKITGAIALRDCLFQGCSFLAVGYTGPQEFLNDLRSVGV